MPAVVPVEAYLHDVMAIYLVYVDDQHDMVIHRMQQGQCVAELLMTTSQRPMVEILFFSKPTSWT